MKNQRKTEGITLIALVVTIVVLLILAGITITMLFGENGIITKAQLAKDSTEGKGQEELDNLNKLYDKMLGSLGQEKRDIKVEKTITEEQNAWATTVTLNPTIENTTPLTLEQKKNIVLYMYDFANYDELINMVGGKDDYDSLLTSKNLTEENFIDMCIQTGRRFINYKDIAKLESLGVKVISVVTPYNTVLYTSNLGGDVKCSFNKNGTYDFKIRSGATEITEKVTVNNIRTAVTNGPYTVKLENAIYGTGLGDRLMYSVDNQNTWQELTSNAEIQCNNSIYIKFPDDVYNGAEESTFRNFLHYVEKNEEYYKYFVSDPEWVAPRSSYAFYWGLNILRDKASSYRQIPLLASMMDIFGGSQDSAMKELIANCPSDFWEFYMECTINDYGTGTNNEVFPEQLKNTFPRYYVGNDEAISWSASDAANGIENPVCKIEVTHDMNLLLYNESAD